MMIDNIVEGKGKPRALKWKLYADLGRSIEPIAISQRPVCRYFFTVCESEMSTVEWKEELEVNLLDAQSLRDESYS